MTRALVALPIIATLVAGVVVSMPQGVAFWETEATTALAPGCSSPAAITVVTAVAVTTSGAVAEATAPAAAAPGAAAQVCAGTYGEGSEVAQDGDGSASDGSVIVAPAVVIDALGERSPTY